MSGNNVEFGITFTGDGKVASAEIDRVTQSADRLTQATARQNTVASESKNAWLTQTAAIKTSGDEMVSASEGVQKLLAKYDPLGAKLRSLEADFSALNKAAASGQLPASQDAAVDKTYKALNEEIAKTKTLMGQAGVAGYEAFAKVEEGANKGAFATAGAKRELMVLAHEAMSGNFSRMPGSFMVLAERMSITTALFSPLTIGAAAFGVATVGVAVAAHQGHEEMVAMNNALAVTGNYAGLTRGTMRELADSMTQTGTMTIGTAKDIVTALVASGRIGAESIAGVAKLAGNFAAATGQDVAKITPELIKLFADPAKGVEELDKRMHFLNVTDREYIAHLERIGEVGEAQRVSLEKTTAAIPKQTENIGYLGHQWDLLKQSISATGDALAAWGRTTTVNEQLANAKSLIEREGGSVSDAMRGVVPATGSKDLKEAYALVAALQQQADAERAKGVEAGKVAATREKEALAQKEADKSATHQITILRDSLTLLASAPDSAEKTRREFELRKQILDVQRSIGAEGRQLSQEEISYQEKLREVAVKVGTDEIEAQYKLGQVDVVRRDAMLLFYALKSNKSKQTAEEELLLVGNLTAAEKKQHQDKLKILQVEADAIIAAGANKALIDEKKFYDDIRKSVDALGSSEIAALDKTIAAQRLHNAEIGKTPEQIARVKKAAEDFGTAQLDAEAKALRAAAETVVMDQQYKDIYIARANALDIEIAKRRELATAMGDGAFLEANAAAVRKVNEDAKAFTKDVDRALTDGIMRGGKNGGKYLEDYFRTLVFRPGVQFLMSPVAGAISSAFYGAGANGMSLANAGAGAGLYGSFATSAFGQSLGLSAGASGAAAGASVAEATYAQALLTGATTVEASAAATAATTSAMTTLGAALPYIGAALVIANAVGLFGKGGGPQQGQLGTVNANGYTATQNYTGGDTLGNQALAQSAYNQVAALYVAAGKQVAGLSINQGGKLDPEGTAAALGYRQISVGGNVISGQAGWDNPAFTGAHDDAKGLATYLGKLTSDEIEQVAAAINDPKLTDAITKLKANFGDLTVAMPNYLTAQAAQKVLLDPLLTGTEKLNAAQHDLAEAGLPNTREGLKDLIKSLDLTTQAGQDTQRTIVSLAGAFQIVDASATSLLDARGKVTSALRDISAQVTSFGQKVVDTAKGVGAAKDDISKAYWAAVDTENQLMLRAAENLAKFTTSIDDFLVTLTPAQSLETLKAQLSMTAVLAKAGDVDSQNKLVNLGKSVMKASEAESPDKLSNDRTAAFVRNTLTDVRDTLAPAQTAASMAAGDLAKQLAAAKLAVVDLGLIATATGVATQKSSIIQLSGTDLLTAYNKAIEDSNAAQADYTRAVALTSGLQLRSADSLQSLIDSIYGLGDAEDALVKAGGKVGDSFGITKDEADKLATKLGLSGGAADSFVKALTDPLPGLTDSFGKFKIYVDGLIGNVGVTAPGGGPGQTVTPASLQDTWVGDKWRSPGGVTLDRATGTFASTATQSSGTFASLQSAWADIQKAVGSGQMTELQAGTNIIAAVKAAGGDAKTLDAAMIAAGVSGWTVGTANAWAKAHDLPAFAGGTDYFGGGWRVVGERGPELEATGSSRIFNAQQTRDIFSGNSQAMNSGELQRIAAAIERLEDRQSRQATAFVTRLNDLYKLHKDWNSEGMPPARVETV